MEKGGTEDVEPLMRKVVQKLAEAAGFFQGIEEVDDALVDAIALHVRLWYPWPIVWVEWVKRGLETRPSSMDLWFKGVKLYLELGNIRKAKDMIERSLSQKPSPSYLERLMGIAEKHGLLDDNPVRPKYRLLA